MDLPKLVVVLPCYNEEAVLPETIRQMTTLLADIKSQKKINETSCLLFVDDGSKDNTWKLITDFSTTHPEVTGVKLSRNFGHQGALIAGLTSAVDSADCIVSIDCDLQDDIEAIRDMVEQYHNGYEVVYGVRDKRQTDTIFKRRTALAFYSIMGKMGVELKPNHADFRLLSQRATKEFLRFKEVNPFIRGIVPLIGFNSTDVFYNRKERFAGESKYPLKKMIAFALDGIFSLTIVPIKFIGRLGSLMVLIAVIMAVYTLFQKIFGNTVSGWSSSILSIWFIGGVQMVSLSIIGEYIGRIFDQTKVRPRFIIEKDLYQEKLDK